MEGVVHSVDLVWNGPERQLGLSRPWRTAGGRLNGEPEVRQDLLGNRPGVDHRDETHGAGAAGASEDVDCERPLEQLRPLQAPLAVGIVGALSVGEQMPGRFTRWLRLRDRLVFGAFPSQNSMHIFVSDGTANGTTAMAPTFTAPWFIGVAGNRYFWSGNGQDGSGLELWSTDGSDAGTLVFFHGKEGSAGGEVRLEEFVADGENYIAYAQRSPAGNFEDVGVFRCVKP